ncbi:MAG TPA: hypothetical protein VGM94_00685 [Galbitalea sp.]|jgi:hypothetical protein
MPLITTEGKADVQIGTNRTRRLVTLRLVSSPKGGQVWSSDLLLTPQQTAHIISELQSALASLPPEPPPTPPGIPER